MENHTQKINQILDRLIELADWTREVREDEKKVHLEVGKFYKALSGNKVYIYYQKNENEFQGIVTGSNFGPVNWTVNGKAEERKGLPLLDIVKEWENNDED